MLPQDQCSDQCSGQHTFDTLKNQTPSQDAPVILYFRIWQFSFQQPACAGQRNAQVQCSACFCVVWDYSCREPAVTEESHSGIPLLGAEYKSADSYKNHRHYLQPLQKPGLAPTKRVCDCAQKRSAKAYFRVPAFPRVKFWMPP